MDWVKRRWQRADPLPKHADAVVVLDAGRFPDGPTATSRDQLRTGEALVRAGVAPVLITTSGARNTAEEARSVAHRLPAGASIVLVTSWAHTRRAARIFEAHGFVVASVPAVRQDTLAYKDRWFTDWLREVVAFTLTPLRGS